MCLTFLESEEQPSDKIYFKDKHFIFIKKYNNNKAQSFGFSSLESMTLEKYNDFNINNKNILDLCSDKKTALLFVPSGSYHLLVDFFNKIINLLEVDKNFELILNFSIYKNEPELEFNKKFIEFLFNFLNDYNIKYKIIKDWTDIDGIVINNFIVFNKTIIESSIITHKLFLKYFDKYLTNINEKPFRKVYLSRKDYANRNIYDTKLSYNQDNRMQNENLLEEYLSANSFECISLDNKFNTFEEQVNYFYSVKVLVATTSAGLTNCLYMQPGSILLELVTPQVIEHSTNYGQSLGVSIHSLWQPITSVKEIDNISISNMKRDAYSVIDKILNTSYIKKIIEE